jgi:hypothetical protein
MEKNYVVNVKTSKGTIVTARGDSAEELMNNIEALIKQGAGDVIAVLEQVLTGAPSEPRVLATDPVALVQASLGGEVVAEVPAFAPKAPPVQASVPAGSDKMCIHGAMVKRTGNGAKGEWRAFFCPTPKGTADQCSPTFANRNTPEWNSF